MPSDRVGAYLDSWSPAEEDDFRLVQSLMSRFTYKPGWVFEVGRDRRSGFVQLMIAFRAEDSRRGPNQIPSYREMTFTAGEPFRIERDDLISISGMFTVPPHLLRPAVNPEARFRQWLRQTLGFIEDHETDEWFRFDGNLVHDPHESQVDRYGV